MVKVSCVLPVYNGVTYLQSAVRSVLAQDYTDFELILIDDGSTDGTTDACRSIAAGDSRVKLIGQENIGIVASLNRGIASARGEYVARMDADDICKLERFSRQVAFLDGHPDVVALGSRQNIIDSQGNFIHSTRGNVWRGGTHFPAAGITLCHPTVMFRRASFLKTKGYSEDFHAAEDYALWIEMSRFGRLAELQDFLLDYRVHSGSTSLVKLTLQRESCLKAELAFQAREIAHDEALGQQIQAAGDLSQILVALPTRASSTMPSRQTVATYFQAQVIKRLANRAPLAETLPQLGILLLQIFISLPRLFFKQDRSTMHAATIAILSAAAAVLRRSQLALVRVRRA